MREGLLWFDDDARRDLAQKVGRAAAHYQRKHGRRPTVCYVHPSLLQENTSTETGSVRIEARASVLRHHFWIGEAGDGD
jgi:hypothetical protein